MAVVLAAGAMAGTVGASDEEGDPPSVTVMTRNLYLGADLLPLVSSGNALELVGNATAAFRTVQATDYPTRVEALADEIVAHQPALVGLQEAALWQRGEENVLDGPVTPADIVVYDFLALLVDTLAERGLDYTVAVEQPTFDAEIPVALGYDVRLTQRNAILARADLPVDALELAEPDQGYFTTNASFETIVGTIVDTRGWTAIDVVAHERPFRVVNTHLDPYDPTIRQAQAQELLEGPLDAAMPVVLMGDLNAQPTQPSIASLLDAGLRDEWPSVGREPGFTCCHDADLTNAEPGLDQRIDYVLVSEGIEATQAELVGAEPGDVVSGLWPSDHAGVVVELRLD